MAKAAPKALPRGAAASSSSVPTLRVGYRGNLDEDNSRAASDEAGDDCVEEEEAVEPGGVDHVVCGGAGEYYESLTNINMVMTSR